MTELTILLLAAAVGFGVSRWTQLPAIPVLIVVGVAASALFPLDSGFLGDVLVLGVTVLVFVAGIELNPSRIRRRGRAAVQVGVVQFFGLGAVGAGASLLLGFDVETAGYLALALTASSTLVVVKLLRERRMLYEPIGRLVIGVLLLQDLLIIVFIPVVTRISQGWVAMGTGVLATMALMALAAFLVDKVVPQLLERFAFDEETLLLLSLSVLFAFMGIAHFLELPLVSGAFLSGVVLSGFPTAALVRGQVTSLGDFFHALFFTALGAVLSFPTLNELWLALLLAALVVFLTPPLVTLVAERAEFSARPAILSGLLLSQTSEFSLVIALQGFLLGQLDSEIFTVIALMTVFSMVLTPFLASDQVAWRLTHLHPFKRNPELDPRPEGHILLLGCGRHGQALLEDLIVTRHEIVVVDDDPALIGRLRDAGVTAVRGDISDMELLRAVGADRAQVVISTVRRREENAPLLELAQGRVVLVRAFNVEDGVWIQERGGRPVLYSEAALTDFRRWFQEEWDETAGLAS